MAFAGSSRRCHLRNTKCSRSIAIPYQVLFKSTYPQYCFINHVFRYSTPFSPSGSLWQCHPRPGSSRKPSQYALQNTRWPSPRFLSNVLAHPGFCGSNDETWGSRQVLYQCGYVEICGVDMGSTFVAYVLPSC